jgi:microcin C transport system permease protein
VWQLIVQKLPVSISLGLWTFFISYLVAVPLGVAKAVRAGTRFDLITTLLVLVGYAIPGFVLGVRCWWCSAASCSGFRCAG